MGDESEEFPEYEEEIYDYSGGNIGTRRGGPAGGCPPAALARV